MRHVKSASKAMRLTSPSSLLASAREMVPTLAKRAALAEQNRSIPAETIADFKHAGLFRVIQPKCYGGYELDPGVFFDIQMTLAEGCMSSGWVYGVVAVHNWQLALFDPRAQEDVWAKDSSVLIASSYMPKGQVERVDGGFRFSGRWGFSSGVDHASWLFLGGIVFDEKRRAGLSNIPRAALRHLRSTTTGTRSASRARAARKSSSTARSCPSIELIARWTDSPEPVPA